MNRIYEKQIITALQELKFEGKKDIEKVKNYGSAMYEVEEMAVLLQRFWVQFPALTLVAL